MNTSQREPLDEIVLDGAAPAPLTEPESVRLQREAHERKHTLAQVGRMMGDLHILRCKRDAAYKALARAHQETLFRLALVGSLRRGEDGQRILRIGALSALLARAAGCPMEWCELIYQAAPLHDVGYGATGADASSLPEGESHVRLGAMLLGGTDLPVLKLAAEIAITHHERWDGSGFPRCLSRGAIPLSGRIVGLVDHFDSLPGFNVGVEMASDALVRSQLTSSVGSSFDPTLVQQLSEIVPKARTMRAFLSSQAIGYHDPGWDTDWWSVF